MANRSVWRGSKELQLQPDYPRDVDSAQGRSVELLYVGPISRCRAARPGRGQTVAGWPATLKVVETVIQGMPGERGSLLVRLSAESSDGVASGPESEPDQISYEVEWVEIQKRLEEHPRYNVASHPGRPAGWSTVTMQTTASIQGQTLSVYDILESWRNAGTRDEKAAVNQWITTNLPSGSATRLMLSELVAKLQAGTESYVVYAPVARRTGRYTNRRPPPATPCGLRLSTAAVTALDEEFGGLPTGYQWLKVADHASRPAGARLWERREEWQGADRVDADLYAEA